MIFSAPRFVVVDDKESHLRAIVDTLQRLGAPCVGIQYDLAKELNYEYFRGVRCLFMDLHLVDGQASSDERRHYALITHILEESINKNGGPFILIIWTAYGHLSAELQNYINERIDPEKPHARPLAVLSLTKEKFIDIDSGNLNNPDDLREAVESVILSNPQLAALLDWESDVLAAAGDTLASLLSLVPADQRTSAAFPVALDIMLSRLAQETVGQSHVDANPRAAIITALAPILSDRILNQDATEASSNIWKQAITQHNNKKLATASPDEAGKVNRILHLAMPDSEALLPTDWGTVVKWPFQWNDEEVKRLTGLTIKQMMCEEFRLRSRAISVCKPILVRVGAACDYAQNNRGPIMFLFGVDIPESADRQKDSNNRPVKLTDAIWKSPVFLMPEAEEVSRLYVHIRFPQTFLPEACVEWETWCRLREQILMHLITAASNHVARPGIVRLPVA